MVCGCNYSGQLGLGEKQSSDTFIPVDLRAVIQNDKVIALAAGRSHSLLLTMKGRVLACGANLCGELGLGNCLPHYQFTKVDLKSILEADDKIIALSAGLSLSFLLSAKGRLYACGSNEVGQLGLGQKKQVHTFSLVDLSQVLHKGDKIVAVKTCHQHSLLLTDKGEVLASGSQFWQGVQHPIGDSFSYVSLSALLQENDSIVAMEVSGSHSFLLTAEGEIIVFGDNIFQLSVGTHPFKLDLSFLNKKEEKPSESQCIIS